MLKKVQYLWNNYSLSIVLFFLFIFSWLGQFFVQLREIEDEAIDKGQILEWNHFWAKF